MKPPCEVVARTVLPSIRALIARHLIERHNFTQVDAAKKLGLTQSAMSRYLSAERGRVVEVTKSIEATVKDIAAGIAEEKLSQENIILKMCGICSTLKTGGALCTLHRRIIPALSEKCELCDLIFRDLHLSKT